MRSAGVSEEKINRFIVESKKKIEQMNANNGGTVVMDEKALKEKLEQKVGPMHGWGIARRIEQVSENLLRLNQGTLYPALLRLEQRGWIHSKWGVSENSRRARYYSITRRGERQLDIERENWERMSGIISRLLQAAP
jgi:PadR family transcriptional regulator PadR